MGVRVRVLITGIASLTSRSLPYARCFHGWTTSQPPPGLIPFSSSDRRKLNPTLYIPRSNYSRKGSRPITEPETPNLSEAADLVNKLFFLPPGVKPEDVTANMVLPGSNIVIGPHAREHRVKEVQFIKSSSHANECPRDFFPEFAFFGRSNVGKSSLLNALVHRKLAPFSKTPGKTRSIDHYLINKKWFFVDLPGYGHARVSDTTKIEWNSFTKGFFHLRANLAAVLLLIDPNVPPKPTDLDCASWLGRNNIPMTFVFTKCDKLRGNKEGKGPNVYLKEFKALMGKKYDLQPPWIMTSSREGSGINDLLLHIAQIRNYWDER